MALVKLSNICSSIQGRVGVIYFKRDPAGFHVQSMPRNWRKICYTNKITSGLPGFIPANSWIWAFTVTANTWFNVFALGLSSLWYLFAQTWLFFRGEGKEPIYLSAYNWYLRFNVSRAARGFPLYVRPPKSPCELPIKAGSGLYFGSLVFNFYKIGDWNGRELYFEEYYGWCLWWKSPSWYFSKYPGDDETLPYWYRNDYEPNGVYLPASVSDENYLVSD